ncbi:MAG: Integral membrane protein TerC family protein [Pelotomaculum sp. PtaU1.Bin065]|nr:MAG: Integral membrane protein TerC family protein [Pelotomaculum sp. PtaU1.Bin065]
MVESEVVISILSIIIIDLVLGGDNAVMIAMACKALPAEQRKKAIIFGTAGAVIMRVVLTAIALYLLKIPFLQFAGGALLVWIALKLLFEEKAAAVECDVGKSLFNAIKIIIMADVVMGIDNVLGIAGAAQGSLERVIFGLLFSVPIIVWGSTIILKWLDRYPGIVYIGAGVLAWTAGKMITKDIIIYENIGRYIPYFDFALPVVVLIFVLATGLYMNKVVKRKEVGKNSV